MRPYLGRHPRRHPAHFDQRCQFQPPRPPRTPTGSGGGSDQRPHFACHAPARALSPEYGAGDAAIDSGGGPVANAASS
eukprot:2458792-Rhodomonas_salina.1